LLAGAGGELPGFDVAYVDPPYNQHQYGSNYHLLNTIALWDGIIPGDHETGGKAGIRKDWVKTRSDYCYRERAPSALADLLPGIDARYIFISYSTEGIIPFDELIDICMSRGRVTMITDEYVVYRGGRQSIHRLNHNVEFVIIIDSAASVQPDDRAIIEDIVTARKLNLQLKRSFSRARLSKHFLVDAGTERIGLSGDGYTLWLRTRGFFKIHETDLNTLIDGLELDIHTSRRSRMNLLENLQHCVCIDRVEELQELLRIIDEKREDRLYFTVLLPGILRKMAHRKYRELFTRSLFEIRELKNRHPEEYARIAKKLDAVEELASKRFSG
jgi:adenine-specific DNA-methyltransferase